MFNDDSKTELGAHQARTQSEYQEEDPPYYYNDKRQIKNF